MERAVAIFDTDSLRAQQLGDAMERCGKSARIRIRKVGDIATLNRLVCNGDVDIVFCDVRAFEEDWNGERIRREQQCGTKVQVVYTGVSEANLVRLESTDYAFLLPTEMDDGAVTLALRKSFALQDKGLERPFIVKTRKCRRTIHPGRISFIESDLRKIRIHVGSEMVEAYGKLSGIIHKLPKRFIQCHKSFVVNMGFVEMLEREHLVLTTGECVPVSQKRRRTTREAFDEYVGRVL